MRVEDGIDRDSAAVEEAKTSHAIEDVKHFKHFYME